MESCYIFFLQRSIQKIHWTEESPKTRHKEANDMDVASSQTAEGKEMKNLDSIDEDNRAERLRDQIKANLNPEEEESGPLDNLKREINSLLWDHLPDRTTMGKAEMIACNVFEMIQKEWNSKA